MNTYMTPQEVNALDWKKNPRPLFGKAGVYRVVVRKTGKLIYVGQSKNLGYRLCPSCHEVYKKELHDLYVVFEDDPAERGLLETRLIATFDPPRNHQKGSQPPIAEADLDAAYRAIFG